MSFLNGKNRWLACFWLLATFTAHAQNNTGLRAVVVAATGSGNATRFRVPQVRLASASVSKLINRGILRRVFGDESLDATAPVAQVLQRAAKACCWDADAGQWQTGQGLTGCDYEVLLNEHGLLSLELIQEYTGAYSWERTDHLTFDLRTGQQLQLADVVADSPAQLQRRMHGAITRRLGEVLRTMHADQADTTDIAFVMEQYSWDNSAKRVRFASDVGPVDEARATEPDLQNFALTPRELRLYYGPVMPHVRQDLELDGTYHFPYARVIPRGSLMPLVRAQPTSAAKR